MASSQQWADGYLAQAIADLAAARAMGSASPSTLLLQMVFEKLLSRLPAGAARNALLKKVGEAFGKRAPEVLHRISRIRRVA